MHLLEAEQWADEVQSWRSVGAGGLRRRSVDAGFAPSASFAPSLLFVISFFFFQRSMAPTSVLYVLHANPAHQCSGCLCLIWINETFHMFFYSSSVFLTNLEQCFDVSHSMYIYSTCRPDLPCRFVQQINQYWHASITHLRQTFCPKWHSNYFFDGLKEPGFYLTSISKRIHHRNGQIEHVVDICLQISFLSILKPSPSIRK